MEDNIFDKVHEVDLEKTMKDSYIDYACKAWIPNDASLEYRENLFPCIC